VTPCQWENIYRLFENRIALIFKQSKNKHESWYILRRVKVKGKSKGKVHPITGNKGPEVEYKYSFTSSLTSALNGVGGQHHALATIPRGKTRYPLYKRLGGLQGVSGRERKISPPLEFDPQTIQSVASRYTDCAIPIPPFKNSE